MRLSANTLAIATVALLVICSAAASGETVESVVRGEVIDDSGGVLPGVTVAAISADGRVVGTAVTNGTGGYILKVLAAGTVDLKFQLEGFDTGSIRLVVQPGAESWVVERLGLARITETVVVSAKAPVDPPRPVPPPPPPTLIPVPSHDKASVCGPAKPGAIADSFGTIQAYRHEAKRTLYAKGDEIIIDGGTANGLEVGHNLTVRRHYHVIGAAGGVEIGEHTSGVVQIVSADERSSIAVVVYACDEMMIGDFLASFRPEPVRAPTPVGNPAYDDAARILFADAGQMVGVPRRLMVIDRGTEYSIQVGQRLTLFRRDGPRAKPSNVGDAVVVAVRSDSATIRVESVTDVISFGDWAAPQRQSRVSPIARSLDRD